jgi:mgtE-like transporter
MVALLLSTAAAFIAGLTLSHMTGTLEEIPGLLALIPASVGMRGTIFGSIGARLGTSIHAGLFEVSFEQGGVLRRNVEVGVVLTFVSALLIALLAGLFASAFGTDDVSIVDMITISVMGGALGSAVILVVTVVLSAISFRRGYDLDAVGTPMITAIGDMVTLPAIFLATFLTHDETVNAISAALGIAAAIAAFLYAVRFAGPTVRRTLFEMAGVIVVVPILDIFAGALLETRQASLSAVPAVLIVIPPFISQAGALGGILSSRLSSKLQLGVLSPRGSPQRPALLDAGIVTVFATVVFAVIGLTAFALSLLTGLDPPTFASLVGGTMLAGLFALPIIMAAGYYVAISTTRFGLDPDNYGVPIITGLMDLAGIVCILLGMSLSGVAIHG